MEIFRTPVPVPASDKKIDYSSRIMFMGSCFSEYMGQNLENARFSIDNNPFGIVYNPLSVKQQLERLIHGKGYVEDDLFLHQGTWRSFEHHSRFSDADKSGCLNKINDRFTVSKEFLKTADFLFLTFGTSWVYYLKSTGQVVSNCHKVPDKEFTRKMAAVDEIVTAYEKLIPAILKFNPNLTIVFTVSPIRHWKDGAHGNQLSKSVLLLSFDALTQKYPQTFYFPSYEIVMDELRDYRFYAEDMLHPSQVAINYIWDKFKECFMEPSIVSAMREIEQVVKAANHRPLIPGDPAYVVFAKKNYEKILHFKQQYAINLDKEEQFFRAVLAQNS